MKRQQLVMKLGRIKKGVQSTQPVKPNTISCSLRDWLYDLQDTDDDPLIHAAYSSNDPNKQFVLCTENDKSEVLQILHDDKNLNTSLMRCINFIVHVYEQTYLEGKSYQLQMEPSPTIAIKSIGLNASIKKAIQHLWDLDHNCLTPDRDYAINVQKGKKPYQLTDDAKYPLFKFVDKNAFRRPTYRSFIALLDNYCSEVGKAEVVTSKERQENAAFLKAIMNTAPMQFCHKYCVANLGNDAVPSDRNGFEKLLHTLWFDLYHRSRGGRPDSSGFEHVFTGEIKNGEISGFHNWIQFYIEEKRGNVDYHGYIKPRCKTDARTDSDDHVLTVQFSWNGVMKKMGTMFLGVSPEFEMALYTLCFLMGNQENKVDLRTGEENFGLNIKCFTMARNKIGTSYPEVLNHYED